MCILWDYEVPVRRWSESEEWNIATCQIWNTLFQEVKKMTPNDVGKAQSIYPRRRSTSQSHCRPGFEKFECPTPICDTYQWTYNKFELIPAKSSFCTQLWTCRTNWTKFGHRSDLTKLLELHFAHCRPRPPHDVGLNVERWALTVELRV